MRRIPCTVCLVQPRNEEHVLGTRPRLMTVPPSGIGHSPQAPRSGGVIRRAKRHIIGCESHVLTSRRHRARAFDGHACPLLVWDSGGARAQTRSHRGGVGRRVESRTQLVSLARVLLTSARPHLTYSKLPVYWKVADNYAHRPRCCATGHTAGTKLCGIPRSYLDCLLRRLRTWVVAQGHMYDDPARAATCMEHGSQRIEKGEESHSVYNEVRRQCP
ncbi:hypothetical protein C8Q79DRAFT_62528 [Trametes meyenii]|nr:hypothetical protein C8Q79DRAFT_62528 [Trametes meyenii]